MISKIACVMAFLFCSSYQMSLCHCSSPYQEMITQSPGMLGTPLRGCTVADPATALGEGAGARLAPAPSPEAETPHMHQLSLERRLETCSQALLL